MSRKVLLTADELERMPDDDSVQIELDEGELIRMARVVHPDRREVEVFEANGADRTLTAADVLEAPDLLPGFSLAVGDLFAA